jgi:hypothetical protein
VYKDLISWPQGNVMTIVMEELKTWYNLQSVQGAIDNTHIIKAFSYPKDHYYHKTMARV